MPPGLEEDDIVIRRGAGDPAEPLVERARLGEIGDTVIRLRRCSMGEP